MRTEESGESSGKKYDLWEVRNSSSAAAAVLNYSSLPKQPYGFIDEEEDDIDDEAMEEQQIKEFDKEMNLEVDDDESAPSV